MLLKRRLVMLVCASTICFATYLLANWTSTQQKRKVELSNAKRKFRALRSFNRDVTSFGELDIMMKEMFIHIGIKIEISNAKRKFRALRSFNRDVASFGELDIMKEMEVTRPLFNFLVQPWRIKKGKKHKGSKLSMIIIVKSHISNYERRKFIRQTWGSQNHLDNLDFETVFILGTSADNQTIDSAKESEIHGDILQINYNDVYGNLAYKTLAGMQWASDNFPKSWFYASMDDDILPDFSKITSHIHQIIETELNLWQHISRQNSSHSTDLYLADHDLPIYCGFGFRVKPRPRRINESKWFLEEEKYPLKQFPPYCFGGFYAMTVSLTSKFYALSRKLPFFWIDDIWLTGFLRIKYFTSGASNCHYCNVKNTTLGIWTMAPNDFAGAVTGDLDYLRQVWQNMLHAM